MGEGGIKKKKAIQRHRSKLKPKSFSIMENKKVTFLYDRIRCVICFCMNLLRVIQRQMFAGQAFHFWGVPLP